jgi:hypothetical protein
MTLDMLRGVAIAGALTVRYVMTRGERLAIIRRAASFCPRRPAEKTRKKSLRGERAVLCMQHTNRITI